MERWTSPAFSVFTSLSETCRGTVLRAPELLPERINSRPLYLCMSPQTVEQGNYKEENEFPCCGIGSG